MNEGPETYEVILSVVGVIGLLGVFFFIAWRVARQDVFWEKIGAKRGWKVVNSEWSESGWKFETRQGPILFRVGQTWVGRGVTEWDDRYVWVIELEFDAPFPEDLEIEPRTLIPGVAVDERLGGERSVFSLTFQVQTRGRQPVCSPVMQPRLGELLLELQETSDRLTVEKRRIRLLYRQEHINRERFEEIIDRCLEIGEEIADLAGLAHDEGEEDVDVAREEAERAREVRELEVARATVEW